MSLLLILVAIGLVDSLSMIPLALLPMTVALGGRRPAALAGSFVVGVYVVYFCCGLLLLLGAEAFTARFGAGLARLWNQPEALELVIQILVGLLLLVSPWLMRRSSPATPQEAPTAGSSPAAMALLGGTLVLLGIPGAVPYLAAVERIVHQNPQGFAAIAYLLFYNLIFVLPLLSLIGLRFLFPQRAGKIFQSLATLSLSVLPKLTAVAVVALGLVLVADGIGWFLGHPLLPVST
ncbi:GAP family protein [Synechococcus sp. ATX 2A4]|uniref:GAP family protein n=1 Tax=Synechococcus sp. ATX 2A4 TaxID=2823727 RepID=UPI0020CB7D72|nr:GAP family protein [Synechococcus sp. ATX 2A4]MCP9885593.1 GAP family protein [Synechococcus sp. ATX 2A4]